MKKTFVLLDASAIIHRAFHALPPLSTKDGQIVNAVYGFSSILLKIINEIKPDYIAVAFDSKGPTFRHHEYKEYKAKRIKKGQELYSQFPLIKNVLKSFAIPMYETPGFEADDIIATLKTRIKNYELRIKTIIVTGDLDTLQLVDEDTKVYAMRKGLSDIIIYDEHKVKERYGFSSEGIVDYKALAGDQSDNIPGVSGIGEKAASTLICKYKKIDSVYHYLDEQPDRIRRLLENGKDKAFLSKKLATLAYNVPLRFDLSKNAFSNSNQKDVAELFVSLGFNSLLNRLSQGSQQKTLGLQNLADEIDQKLEPILRQMEAKGVLINVEYLQKLSQKTSKDIARLKSQIFHFTGDEFNLDSPLQLSQILFTRMNLPFKGLKKTQKGISTAAPELQKLRSSHCVIDLILRYRELSKLKNTYLDTLPKMVDKNQHLHTTYTQDTQTGRLASKNPNLQNIPIHSKLGNEIRQSFLAPKDHLLISADYSQIELRILAHLSKDEKLQKAFLQGKDIHDFVSKTLNVPRHVAKTINFGVVYGMSAHGLAKTLSISYEEAQNYIDKFFVTYPSLGRYIASCIEKAKKDELVTIFGRHRKLIEINSPLVGVRQAAERMAINFPCQGSGADILKKAMAELFPKLKKLKVNLILTVHDELVFEVPEKETKEAAKIIKETMERVVKLSVPILVKISVGKNWAEMKVI